MSVQIARTSATTATASGTLLPGKHNPVDATSGSKTMALPTPTHEGAYLSVEKVDTSANAVIVSGSIRGATATISLVWQYETLDLYWTGATWRPVSGHKTKIALDAAYAPFVFNPRLFGAKGDGVTDDSAAFAAMRDAVLAARRTSEPGGNKPVTAEIRIPAGRYLLTANDALMSYGLADSTGGLDGLTIRGAGRRATTLVWSPTATSTTDPTVGNLFSAYKRTRWLTVADIYFEITNPLANVFYFFNEGAGAQNEGCVFERLHFDGNARRVFGFDGSATANLNSEMTFRNIGSFGAYTDAFFHVGGISGTFSQQNQFVNYWFDNTVHALDGGTLYKFDCGGAASWRGGSWSSTNSSAPAMTFLSMPQADFNTTSATMFSLDSVRFEPKASTHTIIDYRMGQGNVTFRNCSDVAALQTGGTGNTYTLHKYTGGTPWGPGVGPTVRYVDCALNGNHSYDGGGVDQTFGGFIYDGCYSYRGGNQATANTVSGTNPILQYSNGIPRYSFRNGWNYPDDPALVRGGTTDAFTGTTGATLDTTKWTVSNFLQGGAALGTATIQSNAARLVTAANALAIIHAEAKMLPLGSTDARITFTAATQEVMWVMLSINSSGDLNQGNGGNTTTGFFAQIDVTATAATGQISIWQDGTLLAGKVAKTITAGTAYVIRLQRQGFTLQSKIWAASSAEPTAWDVIANVAALPPIGVAGFGVETSSGTAKTVTFGNFIAT